eukprot:5995925-Amphidinium_carterae.1
MERTATQSQTITPAHPSAGVQVVCRFNLFSKMRTARHKPSNRRRHLSMAVHRGDSNTSINLLSANCGAGQAFGVRTSQPPTAQVRSPRRGGWSHYFLGSWKLCSCMTKCSEHV